MDKNISCGGDLGSHSRKSSLALFAYGAMLLAVPLCGFLVLGSFPQFSALATFDDSIASAVAAAGERDAQTFPGHSKAVADILNNWEYTTHCLGSAVSAGCPVSCSDATGTATPGCGCTAGGCADCSGGCYGCCSTGQGGN